MSAYKAYVVQEPFGLDALTLVERPVPQPGPGQVLIRMRAVSLNYRDLLVIRGVWRPSEPRIPASDGVGEVVAVGEGVTRVKIGDRVAGIFFPGWIDGEATPEKLEPRGEAAAGPRAGRRAGHQLQGFSRLGPAGAGDHREPRRGPYC